MLNAFKDSLVDLDASRVDFDLELHKKRVDFTIGWLCDAAEAGSEEVEELAREAHRAVAELARVLDHADSDDLRTRDKLHRLRMAVGELLRSLEQLVCEEDCAVISAA